MRICKFSAGRGAGWRPTRPPAECAQAEGEKESCPEGDPPAECAQAEGGKESCPQGRTPKPSGVQGGAGRGYTDGANGGRHDAHPRGMPSAPIRRAGRVPAAARGRAHGGRHGRIYAPREVTTPLRPLGLGVRPWGLLSPLRRKGRSPLGVGAVATLPPEPPKIRRHPRKHRLAGVFVTFRFQRGGSGLEIGSTHHLSVVLLEGIEAGAVLELVVVVVTMHTR